MKKLFIISLLLLFIGFVNNSVASLSYDETSTDQVVMQQDATYSVADVVTVPTIAYVQTYRLTPVTVSAEPLQLHEVNQISPITVQANDIISITYNTGTESQAILDSKIRVIYIGDIEYVYIGNTYNKFT